MLMGVYGPCAARVKPVCTAVRYEYVLVCQACVREKELH